MEISVSSTISFIYENANAFTKHNFVGISKYSEQKRSSLSLSLLTELNNGYGLVVAYHLVIAIVASGLVSPNKSRFTPGRNVFT